MPYIGMSTSALPVNDESDYWHAVGDGCDVGLGTPDAEVVRQARAEYREWFEWAGVPDLQICLENSGSKQAAERGEVLVLSLPDDTAGNEGEDLCLETVDLEGCNPETFQQEMTDLLLPFTEQDMIDWYMAARDAKEDQCESELPSGCRAAWRRNREIKEAAEAEAAEAEDDE